MDDDRKLEQLLAARVRQEAGRSKRYWHCWSHVQTYAACTRWLTWWSRAFSGAPEPDAIQAAARGWSHSQAVFERARPAPHQPTISGQMPRPSARSILACKVTSCRSRARVRPHRRGLHRLQSAELVARAAALGRYGVCLTIAEMRRPAGPSVMRYVDSIRDISLPSARMRAKRPWCTAHDLLRTVDSAPSTSLRS